VWLLTYEVAQVDDDSVGLLDGEGEDVAVVRDLKRDPRQDVLWQRSRAILSL
jgi:hypothetical protein